MTNLFELLEVDASGKTLSRKSAAQITVRVMSDEIMPIDAGKGAEAYIIDKVDVAVSDGRGNWYRKADTPVAGGQPWSALF